jgi:hypothetical protein
MQFSGSSDELILRLDLGRAAVEQRTVPGDIASPL